MAPGSAGTASNVPVPPGWSGVFLSMLSFLLFTDMGIYWIHRALHHKLLYKVRDRMAGSGREPSPRAGAMAEPVLPGKACSRENGRLRLAE